MSNPSKFPERVWEKTEGGWFSREATPEDRQRRAEFDSWLRERMIANDRQGLREGGQ